MTRQRKTSTPVPTFSGTKLKAARLARGMKHEELAAEAQIGCATLMRYERNANAPSFDIAIRLARILDVHIDDLAAS